MDRRNQIIEKLKHMSNAELDLFINLMLRLREMPEATAKPLSEAQAHKKDIEAPLPVPPEAMSEAATPFPAVTG